MANTNHRLQRFSRHPKPGFFGDFPHQGLLYGFSRLYLAAGKFQQSSLMYVLRPPGDQYPTITHDYRYRHMDQFVHCHGRGLRCGIRH